MGKSFIVILVCCAYFTILILVGILVMTRNRKTSDFLVAGRKLDLLFTVATLSAVQIGAGIILGGSSTGASMGIWPGMWYSLGCGEGLIIAGIRCYKGVMICATVILIYSSLGGLWEIALTDVIQTAIIMISIPVVSIVSLLLLNSHHISPAAVFSTPFIQPVNYKSSVSCIKVRQENI